MKHIILMSAFLLIYIDCMAQDEALKTKADSLSYVSRIKAGLVLRHFDGMKTKKILYSISNEQYYVIMKDSCCYKEYYIHTDSMGNMVEQRAIETSKQTGKLMAEAFNLNSYRRDFVTRADKPTVVEGNSSYFVLKDADGKRYGEYSLSVITMPVPINKQLYSYLVTRLLRESTKKNDQ